MNIRDAIPSDLPEILNVTRDAFGGDEEAGLVQDLLKDPTAAPVLSLVAVQNDQVIGHILFTAAQLTQAGSSAGPMSILAPLSVTPNAQSQGVGGALIKTGLDRLSASGTHLVFVLGHPEYYPRHGFQPAGRLGFDAPFPIADIHADAWMVQALVPDALEANAGDVCCADTLNKPEYWQE